MLCPVCANADAMKHPILGILPCVPCGLRRGKLKSPDHPVEFTSNQIKMDRREYSRDIIQPRRGNEPSLEYINAYPARAKEMFTQKEIKNAREVWK